MNIFIWATGFSCGIIFMMVVGFVVDQINEPDSFCNRIVTGIEESSKYKQKNRSLRIRLRELSESYAKLIVVFESLKKDKDRLEDSTISLSNLEADVDANLASLRYRLSKEKAES